MFINSGDVTLSNSTITGNSVGKNGGGIYNAGTLIIDKSTISNNSTFRGAGGGGIWNSQTLTMTNSTISGNRTGGNGGGLLTTSASITNSTISGNLAESNGGGIWNSQTVTITNTTVAKNSALAFGGGGIWNNGTFRSRNSIIGDNTAPNSPDFNGILTSLGFTLIENTSGTSVRGTSTGNVIGEDPMLAPLADNGGPTQTHLLLFGSPAIDKGNASGSIYDQRGSNFGRTCDYPAIPNADGDGSDIGSIEIQ